MTQIPYTFNIFLGLIFWKMHKFKELKVWQRSIELVTAVYDASKDFPDFEKFRLLSQVCGAAVSIPSNIAEGAGRGSNKQFDQFLGYSLGSSFELETQCVVAKNLGYISSDKYEELSNELYQIQGMLIKLKQSLK